MTLTPEQKKTVAEWVAAGDSLSVIQKKLSEQLKVSMTYMDVRFLVDDLNLQLKDAAPKADASDVTKVPPPAPRGAGEKPAEKKGFFDKAKEKLGLAKEESAQDAEWAEEADADGFPPEDELAGDAPGGGGVTVSVDKVTIHPGALASGSVTFSDGVTGKWIVDNYGRPGFTEISTPGYRPNPADAQAFMQELSLQLQRKGF